MLAKGFNTVVMGIRYSIFISFLLSSCFVSTLTFAKYLPLTIESSSSLSENNVDSASILSPKERAWLDESHTVRVRVGDQPPWEKTKPEPMGMAVDYLTLIGKKFGITFALLPAEETWADGFNDVAGEHRKYDLILAAKRTDERLESLSMSDNYLFSPWVIITRVDTASVKNLKDLHLKRVSVEREYVINNLLKKNEPEIQLIIEESTADALLSLYTGQTDAYIGSLAVTSYLIKHKGITNLKVVGSTPYGAHNQAMATRKEWAPLISIINKGLHSLTVQEVAQIQNKYPPVQFERVVTAEIVFYWALGIAVLAAITIFLFYLWNRSLKRQVWDRTIELKNINTSLELEISERKKVEMTAYESTQNLRNAQSTAHLGNWSWDIKLNEITWSDELYRIYEVTPGTSLTYERLMEIIHPKDRTLHDKKVAGWLAEKVCRPFEYRIVLSDNSVRYIYAMAEVERNEAGEPIRIFGVVQDISERKLAEAALVKSDEKYRNLVNDSMVGIFNTNIKGEFTYVNKAMVNMYDFNSVDEMLQDGSLSRWVDLQQRGKMLIELKMKGSVTNFEAETITNIGRHIHVLLSAKLNGNTITGMVMDVTDRRQAEEQIRLSSEIITNIHEGVYLIRAEDGIIIFTNPAFENMFGYGPNEMLGKHASILNAKSDTAPEEKYREIISELNVSGKWKGETHNIKKDGTRFWCYAQVNYFDHPEHGPVWVTVHTDITEQREAEAALAESESKYRDLVDNSLVGVFTTDLSGKFIFANSALAKMYDFSNIEEMLAMGSLPRWTNPKQREDMLKFLKNDGRVTDFEAETTTKCGRNIVVLVTATLHDEKIIGMVMDITARKDAERSLKENEARLRMIYEHAPIMIDSFDANGQCTMWNKECERVLGWTAEEVSSHKNPISLFYPDPEIQKKVLKSVVSNPNNAFEEWHPFRKDGEQLTCLWSNFKLPDGDIISLGQDVTERKKSEVALSERESTLAALLNAPLESIILISSDRIVLSVNEGGARRFGTTPNDLIGRNVFEMMPPDIAKVREGVFDEVFRTGKPFHFEDERKGRQLSNSVYPVFDTNEEKVLSVAIFSTDITERKQSEIKLKVSQKKLKDMLAQLTIAEERERRVIAEDLHDHVGQSLALSRLQLATARKGLPHGDRLDAQLEDISQSLLKAIQDTRHLIFELSSPSLNELGLSAAISELSEDMLEGKYGIRCEVIDHAKGIQLDADVRAILFRSVRELLTNIVKHAEAKFVSIWLESKADNFMITIQDDGVGFDPSPTLHNVNSKGGFGLFSIQERTVDLGGKVKISSRPGSGCEITIEIPLEVEKKELSYEAH